MIPSDCLYTKEHEWLKVEGDQATVGITDHAQSELGDIVYVELPDVGDTFSSGEEFGSVESTKAVAEIFMPITGEILEVNEALDEGPDLVNTSPHQKGWLVKIRIEDESELDDLMDAKAYQAFVDQESA